MMHGRGKSDFAIVAVKPANKAEQSATEPVERRAETEGNAGQQSTYWAQSQVNVSQALERIRRVATRNQKHIVAVAALAASDTCSPPVATSTETEA
jgi:hypothetical protein